MSLFWIALLSMLITLSAAAGVLILNNYLAAVAAASVVSLAVSVFFLILQAPDVALAEAVVGAGLSGAILALALRKVGLWHTDRLFERREDS